MRSTRRRRSPAVNLRAGPRVASWCLLIALGVAGTAAPAAAQDAPSSQDVPPPDALPTGGPDASQDLLLGVIVNDRSTGTLATFRRLPDGRLAATPGDLSTAGIKPGIGTVNNDGLVPLDSLAGVTWRYDEPKQTVVFTAPDTARVPTSVDVGAGSRPVDLSAVRSDLGFLLNYTLYGTSQYDWSSAGSTTNTLSGSFDARVLSRLGIVSTTALARVNDFDHFDNESNGFIRLDSAWRYTDPENLFVYQAGDSISGSLSWTSSYRFGGLQFKRNFDIRPDLVTTPVPNLAGTASVPSTLDLYLNNIRVFSGEVPAGPFDFTGLPFLGGGGDARIVMKDALGREIVTQRSYFFAPDMLRADFFDFSVELGFVRLGYGDKSFQYDRSLAGSASVRYGLTDWVTLEGHFEATRGLFNGGAGVVTSLGPYGAINAAAAASQYGAKDGDETGGKVSAFYQVSRNGYSFYAGADRMLGDYNDVGLVVDRRHDNDAPISSRAREILRTGVSFPLGFDPSSLSLGFSRIRGAGRDGDSSILTASWSRTVFDDVSVYVTGYGDFDDRSNYGVFAGVTIPLGGDMTASANVSRTGNRTSFDTSVTKSARLEEGSLGWAVRDQETVDGTGNRSATVNYRSAVAYLQGSLEQSGDMGRVTGTVEGSIVAAGGGVFLANRVDDAFAVVKAGGPNVEVSLNNRRVAITNSGGRAFVPYLQSYQNNTISIDPANLALDLQPDETQTVVVPADRSGAVVDFGVKKVDAAVVSLTGPDGKPLPVGAVVQLDGTDQATVTGYDGRTYLTGLSGRNGVTVTLPEAAGTCRAGFDYQPVPGAQPEIGPVPCR
ncbi:fimbria/pilus outer membrane usher protein [Inquilinus limosus]|uniref:Fimbrial biogenesis outer membrane usher protein n=1 Tax=Inquilinus limosus TaxID=171674 RepID=A0A211ZLD6_9PROT|nr:fimbria/pilus outer membrane usher protein [Inquilinus limosus]OWJ66103.1 fimbrial biogenesis outer membrane usher protein [Inquilinus limosus]